jgi:hypothetical protein
MSSVATRYPMQSIVIPHSEPHRSYGHHGPVVVRRTYGNGGNGGIFPFNAVLP